MDNIEPEKKIIKTRFYKIENFTEIIGIMTSIIFLKFANLQIFANLYNVVLYESAAELPKVEMLSFGQSSGEENANYQKI